MRNKAYRHKEILAILQRQHLGTQAAIAACLRKRGLAVSQATLSKDLKELGLVKAPQQDGRFRYCLPAGDSLPRNRRELRQELSDLLLGMEAAGHMLVLKTPPGNAPGLAAALDRTGWEEVVGTVAGDDTILAVCRSAAQARTVRERVWAIIQNP
jgi:transcriptional regulator of arginine metabolism